MKTVTHRLAVLTMAAALALGPVACDDDDGTGPRPPALSRADVAGQYEMVALSFDPQGILPQENLLDDLDDVSVPELVVSSTEDSLQLVFRDPEGGLVRTEPGSYDLGDTGIAVRFRTASEPGKLLLPRNIPLTYSEEEGDLSFSGQIQADTTRLFQLVEEWSGEPVSNPLPGVLQVIFHRADP